MKNPYRSRGDESDAKLACLTLPEKVMVNRDASGNISGAGDKRQPGWCGGSDATDDTVGNPVAVSCVCESFVVHKIAPPNGHRKIIPKGGAQVKHYFDVSSP